MPKNYSYKRIYLFYNVLYNSKKFDCNKNYSIIYLFTKIFDV